MVLISTFLLTVFLDLTIAIQVGMLLAVILFMRRMASVTNVGFITRELNDEDEQADPNAISFRQVPKGVEVFEINGPFFFGATSKFQDELRLFKTFPQIIVLRMRNVPAIDASGLHTLKEFITICKSKILRLFFPEFITQPLFAMTQAGLLDLYGGRIHFR